MVTESRYQLQEAQAEIPNKRAKRNPFDSFSQAVRNAVKQVYLHLTGPAPDRDVWANPWESTLAHVGCVIGIGNMWRFPTYCYKYEGATFLVAYLVIVLLLGLPEFIVDVSLGQYLSLGATHIYGYMAPIAQGLGWAMVLVAAMVSIYYNVVLAWALYYIGFSFTSELPWAHCNNDFNSEGCTDSSYNKSFMAAHDFFRWEVLGLSENGSERQYELQEGLVLSLAVAWVVVMLCLTRGVKSSGKVVYVTVMYPFMVLICLLIWSYDSMKRKDWDSSVRHYFLQVNTDKLLTTELWVDAVSQVSFGLGAVYGSHTTLASYGKFHQNTIVCSVFVVMCNSVTSILCGFLVFNSLTQLASEMYITIDDLFSKDVFGNLGVELVFVAYPALLGRMRSNFWAILFFLMILSLGIDSMIGFMETITTAVFDNFKPLRRYHLPVVAVPCTLLFLISLPLCTRAGVYLVELMHVFTCKVSLAMLGLLKFILVCYIFGFRKLMDLIENEMEVWVPRPIYWYLAVTCTVAAPLCLMGPLVSLILQHRPYRWNGDPIMNTEMEALGWCLAALTCILVPVMTVYAFFKYRKSDWHRLFEPVPELFVPAHRRNDAGNPPSTYTLSSVSSL